MRIINLRLIKSIRLPVMNLALPLIVLNIVISDLIDISISPFVIVGLSFPLPFFFSPHEGEKRAVASKWPRAQYYI